MAIQNKQQKFRFMLVGGVNTALDFGLLFLLKSLGLPVITANLISTSTAFCFSYFANKKYTFKTTDVNIKREVLLFVVVTLFGLWVLQTAVIQATSAALTATGLASNLVLLLAKVAATIVSLVWNYILYSRLVFSSRTAPNNSATKS